MGSLRQTIADACADSTITFDMSQVTSPITLTSGELPINKNLIIAGPGANVLTVQRSNAATSFRIFNITSGAVTISGLTISQGLTSSFSARDGGGIYNSGTLTLSNETFETFHVLRWTCRCSFDRPAGQSLRCLTSFE